MSFRALSIDVGVKNCAFCIESFNEEEFDQLKVVSISNRFEIDTTPQEEKKGEKKGKRKKTKQRFKITDEFKKVLKRAYSIGNIKYWEVIDFSNEGKLPLDDNRILINLMQFLLSIENLTDKVDLILIERQMKKNHLARRIEGFLFSHFVSKYGIYKEIIDISASRKTQFFRFKDKNKNNRKKFSVEIVKKILKKRGDSSSLQKLLSSKKKDDLADSFLQLFVFKMLVFYDKKY